MNVISITPHKLEEDTTLVHCPPSARSAESGSIQFAHESEQDHAPSVQSPGQQSPPSYPHSAVLFEPSQYPSEYQLEL